MVSGRQAAPEDTASALTKLVALAKEKAGEEEDILGAYSAQLAALCAPHEQALIQQIGAILAEEGDYDAALSRIDELAAKSDKSAWAQALALGMAAANLGGRAEIGGEE